MNRVCSLIVAVALMSSVLMAQTSPNVPRGHWVYDAIQELVQAGLVSQPSVGDAKSEYTRKQGATIVIEAMGSIRKMLDGLPALPKLSFENKTLVSGVDFERYQVSLDVVTLLSKQTAVVSKLSSEFQDELAARSMDISEFTKLHSDIEKAAMHLRIAKFLISMKQEGQSVSPDHWAYNAIRAMVADGCILGHQMVTTDVYQGVSRNQFARLTLSVPAVLVSRVADHEAAVDRWSKSVSSNQAVAETEARLVSEQAMLSQHNVAMVALCFEFSPELQALGYDANSMKKTANDIQSRLNKAARVISNARSAKELSFIPLVTYKPLISRPYNGSSQAIWSKMPLMGVDFDQFWRNFRYSQ